MDRRDFMQSLAATFVSTKLVAFEHATRLNRVGLELYAVRDAMRRDPERTLAAIRAIGYLDVELLWSFDNFGRTPQQVRATLDKEGLRAPSAHMAPEVILKDWDKSLEKAKLLGHEYLIVPSLPGDTAKSLDRWKHWADQFNKAGATAREAGVWLAFHNEPNHMQPLDGVVPYEVFVERTDPSAVRHQLDVGNMALGRVDPMKYLEKYRTRYWSFHVKDVVAGGAKDTELGKGAVDLKALLAKIPEIHRKSVYVEQEAWTDSMESARMNYEFLSRLEF
jgi:sugar phosphate isomerase/epimerase